MTLIFSSHVSFSSVSFMEFLRVRCSGVMKVFSQRNYLVHAFFSSDFVLVE